MIAADNKGVRFPFVSRLASRVRNVLSWKQQVVSNLSPSGNQLVQDLSQRYGVSTDAVTHMLIAVHNGNGTMAQFSHPEFGGAGQWMRGGMTMVSDLFNYSLKSRVDNICNDISNSLANHQLVPFQGSFQSQSQNGEHSQAQASGTMASSNSLFVPDPQVTWWPLSLGSPNATGSQNNVRYAYFSGLRRLAVKTGDDVWVYDTLDHQIGGFSQQQGGGSSITFTSQYGTVSLASLPVVIRNGCDVALQNQALQDQAPTEVKESSTASVSEQGSIVGSGYEEVLATLERLGALQEKGYITQQEFDSKKAELLSRL